MKVLLTNHHLKEFAGSEMNCLTLALGFKEWGYEVEVFTYEFADPLAALFRDNNFVVHDYFDKELRNKHYDLIWSHHKELLNDCIFLRNITADKMIFSSLSPYEPLEALPCYANLLTLCLANSAETKDQMVKEGANEENVVVFPNYATKEYFNSDYKAKEKIKKICIVSNHVALELREFGNRCRKDNIAVDYYGAGDIYCVVDCELLSKYDCVVTIGKTVQCAMAMGIPVYCYDHFGGAGWLGQENIEVNRKFNFSGRGFDRKLNALELYTDVIGNYRAMLGNVEFLKKYAESNFSFEKNFNAILKLIGKVGTTVYLKNILEYPCSTERDTYLYKRMFEKNLMHKNIRDEFERRCAEYKNYCDEYQKQCEEYKNSSSWRLTAPLRKIGAFFRKH